VSPAPWEPVVGIPLVFFVPGYAVAKAIFPEWRVRGEARWKRLLEVATLGFVLSVVLTVVVGALLLAAAPGGFQASWSNPVEEAALAAVALVGFVAGWMRGAYAREPPAAPTPEPDSGEEGAWSLTRRLDELNREERRLRHRLRTTGSSPAERLAIEREIEGLHVEIDRLGREREAAYGR
jgi:hypothetical protein